MQKDRQTPLLKILAHLLSRGKKGKILKNSTVLFHLKKNFISIIDKLYYLNQQKDKKKL